MLGWTVAILCILIPFQMHHSLHRNSEHPVLDFIGGMIGCTLIIAPIVWVIGTLISYFSAGC